MKRSQNENLKKRRKAKQEKHLKYPIPSSQLCSSSVRPHPSRKERSSTPACHHGHFLGQLPGLPGPPRRQAPRLVRALLAPAQRPAALRAVSAATYAGASARAAAGEAAPREARIGGGLGGLDGLGGVVPDAAVRDRRRAGVGRLPGLRRRVRAAQDPLRGRPAAGQHQGRGGGAGGRAAQRNPVLRDAGGRRRRAAAGGPGGDRPAGAGGRSRRGGGADVRRHVRRGEEAAGAGDGLQALHQGHVRGHRVRAALHEERREAARRGSPGARLRRRRRRFRGRPRRAGPPRGHARVRRAGRQGLHRARVRRSDQGAYE